MHKNGYNTIKYKKHRLILIIDLGCGATPTGDVNIDLNPSWSSAKNFILASAEKMPIRSNIASLLVSSHMLEHVLNPFEVLSEIKRVTKKAIIRVPNNPVIFETENHLYSWSRESLQHLLRKVWDEVDVKTQTRYSKDFIETRLFNIISKLGHFKKPMLRILSAFLKLELEAICIRA